MMDDTSTLPIPIDTGHRRVSTLERLAEIPEEEIWLRSRRARAPGAPTGSTCSTSCARWHHHAEELRQADHRAVIAWERFMRETEHAAASTIRRRLAALSSLYKHLVRHGHAARNPVGEVERPAINRDEGSTLAFSKAQARKMLDVPRRTRSREGHGRGIARSRDPVGRLCRSGCAAPRSPRSRSAICTRTAAIDSLRVSRKGGRRDALAINPQTAARLRAYLEAAGHGADIDGPLFRPLKHNGKRQDERRRMDPDAIDRVVRKYAAALGLDRGYSAHSMRATFITTALENGAQLEDVQKAAGHRDPSTTKLYDGAATTRRRRRAFSRLTD